MAISVNMFHWRVTIEVQPRSKNGAPAQSTTGVARISSSHSRPRKEKMPVADAAGRSEPTMATSRSGTVAATLNQKRLVMETNSSLGASSAETARGSSAIPQMGQFPGPGATTSGCMGQVYPAAGAELAGGGAGCAVEACAVATAPVDASVEPSVDAGTGGDGGAPRTPRDAAGGAGRGARYLSGSS